MENRREHCQDIIARSLFSCLSEMDQRARERLREAGLPETPLYRLRELRRIAQEEDRAIEAEALAKGGWSASLGPQPRPLPR